MVTPKHAFLLFFLLLLGEINLLAQSNMGQLLATEQSRFDAMIHRDTVTLQSLLAPDLVYIHSNALRETKAEHIRSVTSGKIVYENMERSNNSVRFYGKTAINTGDIHVKGIISGNPFDVRMLYTAVYRKIKKRWLLVSWQTTRQP